MKIENGKLKIMIATGIYPPDIGGPATYAKQLKDAWGDRATVVTYSRWLRRVPQPLRFVIFFLKTWKASRHVDLIYALSPLGTGVAAALVGKPFAIRVAGDRAWEDAMNAGTTTLMIDEYQKIKTKSYKHKLQAWVCKKAKIVIVPSEYLARLVAGWGIPREKIKVVPNAVATANLAVQPLSGIPGTIILSVGRLVPWKGFRMLIKIMPKILEINPFFRLVIVGDGPDMPHLQVMVANLHLHNKVYLVGKQDPAPYLSAAEFFVLNTGYEGFSHAILEALAQGVPVITTNVGGNPELIRQGENGFMVQYNDEFNLLEAVKTLWHSPELRKKFVDNGMATAAAYTPERTVRETEQALS